MNEQRRKSLRRLPPEFYQRRAYVHWSLTMQDRKTGWLTPVFYYKYREILTHTAFRFGLCCPLYCCMPDHIHMLWVGIHPVTDQRLAMRYFRKQLNPVLEIMQSKLQHQPYDHVLRESECERNAFEDLAEYIARNPERGKLVAPDGYANYSYTGCLVPGYPELKPFETGFWESFWRIYSHLCEHGLQVKPRKDATKT
jgi:REP element-mobilizing transposase RayT